MDYVNRDDRGFVDFEKMVGLDGIAIINIVSNPGNASLTGNKELQSLISHNDGLCCGDSPDRRADVFLVGGTWKVITPPKVDSQGNKYDCDTTVCNNDSGRSIRPSHFPLEMFPSPSRIHGTFRPASHVQYSICPGPDHGCWKRWRKSGRIHGQ